MKMKRDRLHKRLVFAVALSFLFHVAVVILLADISNSPFLPKDGAEGEIIKVSVVSITTAGVKNVTDRKREGTNAAGKQAHADAGAVKTGDEGTSGMDSTTPDKIFLSTESAGCSGCYSAMQAGEGLQKEPQQIASVSYGSRNVIKGTGGEDAQGSTEGTVAVPRYRENSRPLYPAVARSRGYEGLVMLSAEVRADGKAGEVKIAKTSGYPLLDRSALEAVEAWKFEPARRGGMPISMWVEIPIRFSLNDNGN